MKNKVKQALFPFLSWWPMVNKNTIKADLGAGITNAIVVLPQGVAFAMIAGLPPIYGLYTAMVVPVVSALYGSSWHLISGPNTPVSLLFFAVLSLYAEPGSFGFIELAFVLTFIAGAIQLVMGISRMGSLVNFVSSAVIVGFTAGAAILIVTSQIKYILGIDVPSGSSFYENWAYMGGHISETNFYVLLIASSTLLSAILFKKLTKFVSWLPYLLLAMIVGSLVAFYGASGIEGIKFIGKLPSKLPSFHFPELTTGNVTMLFPSAFAVALLGLIQATAIARSIAVKSKQNLDANQEFIGEGLSNIVGSMMMCYASSGSFTRSGINYDAGAKTPMSAIFAAIALALIVLLVAPLAAFLPIAAMSGIILLVAYNLIDFKIIKEYAVTSKSEFAVLVITALSTLFLELQFAIYIGVILSLGLYLKKTSKPRIVALAPNPSLPGRHMQNTELHHLPSCPQLTLLRIDGSIFFGAVDHISRKLDELLKNGDKNVLILAQGINFIDVSGANGLVNEAEKYRDSGGNLYITGMKLNVREIMEKGKYNVAFGLENIFINKESAIKEIYERMDKDVCKNCEIRIFRECESEFGKI
jgi:SulP family sulfate permease